MNRKSRSTILIVGLAVAGVLAGGIGPACASGPTTPSYPGDASKIFWFVQASDIHIGASGSVATTNLNWLVTTAKTAISPSFIIVTGDLTDCTNGNWLGVPDGPHLEEWLAYQSILTGKVDSSNYYDLPGNHDAYSDKYYSFYRTYSVQGSATGKTQLSFTKDFGFGKYLFLGINTADNTGAPFSLVWPYGDNAGLDGTELGFIGSELAAHPDSALTMVFGHHPLKPTGSSTDTYVLYGGPQFISMMDSYYGKAYGYGHTHASSEAFYPTGTSSPGFFYLDLSALGKDSPNEYTVFAIDNNAISSTTRPVGSWPVVLITAPVDKYYGNTNSPYSYNVTASQSGPIRALVFDPGVVTQVSYRIDGLPWMSMTQSAGNPKLWVGNWDSSALAEKDHIIEVQATSASGTKSNAITTFVLNPALQPKSHVDSLLVGKYSGKRVTSFTEASSFTRGETVVFRVTVTDNNKNLLSGATVNLSLWLDGKVVTSLTSGATGTSGTAELKWTTKAPSRRSEGTSLGTYTVSVTGVTAPGYTWDGSSASAPFVLR